MTKDEVIARFKGGITIGDGVYGEEWLLDVNKTTGTALHLLGYDANMYPMPDLATRPVKYQEHVKSEVLKQLKDWNGSIYLDGVLVKVNVLMKKQ